MTDEAFQYNVKKDYENCPLLDVGRMNTICCHCLALKRKGEPRGVCCLNGKVNSPPLRPPPESLRSLISSETVRSEQFLKMIRRYNTCQMTSFGTTNEIRESGFMPSFKVQGQVYHRAGSLLPLPNEEHKFLQIYFMGDEAEEIEQRCKIAPGLDRGIIRELQEMLHLRNNYVKGFKNAIEVMPCDDYQVVIRADKVPNGEHPRRYNAPVGNEVAVVIVGNEFDRRDIVLRKRNGELRRVAETHRSYDALQYPLIFWDGQDGYDFTYRQIDPTTNIATNKKVSAMSFYAYRIMLRGGIGDYLLTCRQLFHQFLVDMYAKIESERLLFIRLNQTKLRADDYIHLRDAVANDGDVFNQGRLVILPSSYTGSPRYMHEYTQDAMTYVRHYGRPDLFITCTCNPKWIEIQKELLPRQSYYDRPDLIARVFKLKSTMLMNLITKGKIFGPIRCKMLSVEWQKRGLPHVHILLWLKKKINPNQIDDIISAELPDQRADPELFSVVVKNMIHGPCGTIKPGAPCMKDELCTKRYPKLFQKETQTGHDGYPLYRRRKCGDGGFETPIRMKVNGIYRNVQVDNRWIVPYCPLLSRLFKAHINVEYCNSVKSIKYICKYIMKGSDQAVFGFSTGSVDEILDYQLGRYISSHEAVWRILDLPLHERYPPVMHLSVHLENGQRVYFTDSNLLERIQEPPQTTLTAFFSLCQHDEFAKTLLYCEVPKYYTWNASKRFKRRVQGIPVEGHAGIKESETLGRVYTIHPNNFECYFLRLLLHTVRGPISFQDIKTVDGQLCATFREACQLRGLLEDDSYIKSTLSEATTIHSAKKLRDLFVIILATCAPSNPSELWDLYKEPLTEDILFAARKAQHQSNLNYTADMFNETLIILENKVFSMIGKNLTEFGMTAPLRHQNNQISSELLREMNYDIRQLHDFIDTNEPLLVQDQKQVYEAILHRVDYNESGIVFVDAPGGTGKTFLLNLILAKVRSRGKIALAVASSGIAATLLSGGRTAHSTFKLPVNLGRTEYPVCNISKNTGTAKLLQECKIIVWDESTMSHKHALEALDRTLRDIRGNPNVMGGMVVLLAGDFRQTLPIIAKGTMADEIQACLKNSYLWRNIKKFNLETNMRIHLSTENPAARYSQQLLDLGEGKLPNNQGVIDFPENFCNLVNDLDTLKEKVFPNIEANFRSYE